MRRILLAAVLVLFACASAYGEFPALRARSVAGDNTGKVTGYLNVPDYPYSGRGTAATDNAMTLDVRVYGAKCDNVTDDYTAIKAAIDNATALSGGVILFPVGNCISGTAFSIPAYVTFRGVGKRTTKLKRGFTGDFITDLGAYAGIEDMSVEGDTATRGAGRGILVTAGTNQHIFNAEIANFSDHCLEFSNNAGSEFKSRDSDYYTTGAIGVIGAIKMNTDNTAVPRHFSETGSGGCTLFDFGNAADTFVNGGFTNGYIFGATSTLAFISNMRSGSTGADIVIAGTNHQITNVSFSDNVIVNAIDSIIDVQAPAYNITDNGTGNSINIKQRDYTPTWSGSVSNPAIGNGTLYGSFSRTGNTVFLTIYLKIGSTTTLGSGAWNWSLPVDPYDYTKYIGYANAYDNSSAGRVVGWSEISTDNVLGAASVITDNSYVGTGANFGAAQPWAWEEDDTVEISIHYNSK